MAETAKLRTVIVDDEPLAVERLQILCARMADLELVGTATDGPAALRLAAALSPDLLLLDIAMPGMDGIEVARALGELAASLSVIFVTAFDQFAVAAFDVAAMDYLLKPVASERLERAIARVRIARETAPAARQAASPWTTEFWVPHRSEIMRIGASEIDLIEAERDYMRLYVGSRSYLVHRTISDLERQLDPEKFIRVHRSTIVPRDRIVGLKHDGSGTWDAVLRGGAVLRIGRSFLAGVRAMAGRVV